MEPKLLTEEDLFQGRMSSPDGNSHCCLQWGINWFGEKSAKLQKYIELLPKKHGLVFAWADTTPKSEVVSKINEVLKTMGVVAEQI